MKKQKKFGRKLVVNKETIASLDEGNIKDLRAGISGMVSCKICPCESPYTPPDTLNCTMFCG